jgi:hypothetical protein
MVIVVVKMMLGGVACGLRRGTSRVGLGGDSTPDTKAGARRQRTSASRARVVRLAFVTGRRQVLGSRTA